MTASKTRFIVPSHIVSENYEREVLAINLNSGTYYSLTAESPKLWGLIQKHESVEAIIQSFNHESLSSPNKITAAVHSFLAQLLAEGLIISESPNGFDLERNDSTLSPNIGDTDDEPIFALQIFTDMQDLLLLDPIHDVESEGWPVARIATSDNR